MGKIKDLLQNIPENPYDDCDPRQDLEEARMIYLKELDNVIAKRLQEDFQYMMRDKDND